VEGWWAAFSRHSQGTQWATGFSRSKPGLFYECIIIISGLGVCFCEESVCTRSFGAKPGKPSSLDSTSASEEMTMSQSTRNIEIKDDPTAGIGVAGGLVGSGHVLIISAQSSDPGADGGCSGCAETR